jgi:poly(hydroxyalkanoate) granule-associated protein
MKRTHRSRRNTRGSSADPSQALRDSAQKIWLAGLGALERARTDGPRVFESLVEQGRNMGARAVGMADEALKNMRQADFSGNRWEKVEQAFEERLTRSLGRLGVLTGKDVESLTRQVHDLSESMRRFMSGVAGAGSAAAAEPEAQPRARRAPGAAAKAARRRRAAKAAATPRAGTGSAPRKAARTRKAAPRKARKAGRTPKA